MSDAPANHERVPRRIEFRDTDSAGIAHFSTFFNFMEEAEHEFLRRRGLSVFLRDDAGPISFPRVSAKCDYVSAVRFEDEIAIDVAIRRLGTKSVTYGFTITCGDRLVARGEMASVCCRLSHNAPPQGIPIPEWIREKLEQNQEEH
jgi:4-hydroxybenzoyl-CoA thioesterase/acyl-CoA thioester hydrolase